MIIEEIRKRLTGGFQPFIIRTSDGREFKVPHPEFIAVSRFGVVVVDDDDGFNTITALHIASIRDLNNRRRNGKRAA